MSEGKLGAGEEVRRVDIWGRMSERQGHGSRCQGQTERLSGRAEWRARR